MSIKKILSLFILITFNSFFFIGFLKKRRLIHVDESAFGHLVGDTLVFLIHEKNDNLLYYLPLHKPINEDYVNFLKTRIIIVRSSMLRKIAAILRDTNYICNLTTMLNGYHDKQSFFAPIKYPKYNYRNIDLKKISKIIPDNLTNYKKLNKYNLTKNKYSLINLRNNSKFRFRNSIQMQVKEILDFLKNQNEIIVNISDLYLEGTINLKKMHHYDINDNFSLIKNAKCYIGDSSGATVIALLMSQKVFAYNYYPINHKPPNSCFFSYMKVETKNNNIDYNLINNIDDMIENEIIVYNTAPTFNEFKIFWELI